MYAQGIPDSQPTDVQGGTGQQQSAGIPRPEAYVPQQPMMQTGLMRSGPGIRTVIAAIAIIVVVAIAGVVIVSRTPSSTTTTSTMQIIKVGSVDSCGEISGPGNYFLSANIKTTISSGACINITASNVALVCNQHRIAGSGPYSGVPPFTYGILINAQSNVSVSGCIIANFSYGVYAQASSNVSVHDNNLTSNYLSDAYLSGTRNSSIGDNLMSEASGTDGALYLANGSSNNKVYNNTIQNNRFYGIGINSTGNSYINNRLDDNPSSFYCGAPSSFPKSSFAEGNSCYNNTGCAFVTCKGINTPANLSAISLSNRINSCGSIVSPGFYRLTSDLNTAMFANTSNPIFLQSRTPCIAIDANDTTLNCKGFSITNASVAILADGKSNVTITNCSISGSGYGVELSNATDADMSNMTFRGDTFALSLQNVTASTIRNIVSLGGRYGIYVLDSLSDDFLGFNTSNNQYGIYLSESTGNLFSRGVALNNSKIDVYATADSVGAGYDLMQKTDCGLSNTRWASCGQYISSSLAYYPLSNCATLRRQGNYTLTANIINPPTMCMTIAADNVTLNCAGYSLFQSGSTVGPAFYLNGRNNVTIRNCAIYGFTTAINVSNSSDIGIYGVAAHSTLYGISLSNVIGSTIENSVVTNAGNASIKLLHVSMSNIIRNNVSYGVGNNYGILINDSQRNRIINNTGATNYVDMYFVGNSQNNTVMNNTMRLGGYADYLCNGNSGINDEIGGINYGATKIGCSWLAVLIGGAPQVDCEVALQSDIYSITSDEEYNYGATCYSVYANDTTIDCNGHTVIATGGGTFAFFKNVIGASIENCTLKGFTSPIVVVNSSIAVLNNRILENSTTSAAITLTKVFNSRILSNNITASYQGISMAFSAGTSLLNNIVALASTAYQLASSAGMVITNNTAMGSAGTGLVLSNTTGSVLKNNMFLAKKGIVCLNASQGKTGDIDSGGNSCTSISSCAWMTNSSYGCHS
jgi:parallel beta-helix repeat protein